MPYKIKEGDRDRVSEETASEIELQVIGIGSFYIFLVANA